MASRNGYTYSTMTITPKKAESLLASAAPNRYVSRPWIAELARQIKSGLWDPSAPDGIKFDKSGRLIDGQHRLNAVIKAGVPIRVIACHGVDEAASVFIDDSRRRTLRDAATIHGVQTQRRTAEIAMAMINAFQSKYVRPSKQEGMAFIERYKESIDWAETHMKHTPKLTPAPVMAVVAKAHANGVDQERLARWCDIYISGEGHEAKGERCAFLARECMLRRDAGGYGRAHVNNISRLISASIVRFLARRDVKKLLMVKDDPYPVEAGFECSV